MIEKLPSGKVAITLQQCGKCRNVIEMISAPVTGSAMDAIVYGIMHDRDNSLKIPFDSFRLQCPVHKDQLEGSTCVTMDEDELKILNETPLSNIWMTVE